jgi:valyl-tRNA synthetase
MSDALMTTYKLIWDDYCSWYLEMVKPDFIDGVAAPVSKETLEATIGFFENLLRVIHPWMPFISEELWHLLKDRNAKECLIVGNWPGVSVQDKNILSGFSVASEIIQQIRNTRKSKNISPKEPLELLFKNDSGFNKTFSSVIKRLANLKTFQETNQKPTNALSFLVNQYEFYLPFSEAIDAGEERERLKKELEYNKGFLKSVQSKLANERFMANAKPDVVENEKRKQADAEAKIRAIEEQLQALK